MLKTSNCNFVKFIQNSSNVNILSLQYLNLGTILSLSVTSTGVSRWILNLYAELCNCIELLNVNYNYFLFYIYLIKITKT